eukprot:TRINITY_DN1847_c0_g1_i6.p1 TRINITY_DN1847_c0_g1~~TRINITY_DN1847_c0_g1_i6.p1  ORF type:complete len:557 (-),score=122.91 TRINITY_DN1847_c0_g1_i6:39-1709(-)
MERSRTNSEKKKELENSYKEHWEFYQNVLRHLPIQNSWCWIEVNWLKKMLKSNPSHASPLLPPTLPPIPNDLIMCQHNRVGLDLKKMKRIGLKAWEVLHARYGGGPLLGPKNLCRECVKVKFDELLALTENRKKFNQIKQMVSCLSLFPRYDYMWINSSWLTTWKNCKFEEENQLDPNFMTHLTCEHGGLTPKNIKAAVPFEVWSYFQNKFSGNIQGYDCDTSVCEICSTVIKRRTEEKNCLKHLPFNPILARKGDSVYVVSRQWYNQWLAFVDDSLSLPPDDLLSISPLLCEHGQLNCDIAKKIEKDPHNRNLPFLLIEKKSWETLLKYHPSLPSPIRMTFDSYTFLRDHLEFEASFNHKICSACLSSRKEKQKAPMDFKNTKIRLKVDFRLGCSTPDPTLVVSHTNTVGELKLFICQEFDILPYKQDLWSNGIHLNDDEKTLSDFMFDPNFKLEVREYSTDMKRVPQNTACAHNTVEVGFEGTQLLAKSPKPERSTAESPNPAVQLLPPTPPPPSTPKLEENQWECPQCTFINTTVPTVRKSNKICEICETEFE